MYNNFFNWDWNLICIVLLQTSGKFQNCIQHDKVSKYQFLYCNTEFFFVFQINKFLFLLWICCVINYPLSSYIYNFICVCIAQKIVYRLIWNFYTMLRFRIRPGWHWNLLGNKGIYIHKPFKIGNVQPKNITLFPKMYVSNENSCPWLLLQ